LIFSKIFQQKKDCTKKICENIFSRDYLRKKKSANVKENEVRVNKILIRFSSTQCPVLKTLPVKMSNFLEEKEKNAGLEIF